MRIFLEIHHDNPQEGPGDFVSTRRAFFLLKDLPPLPHILDAGCGPGRQTFDLCRKYSDYYGYVFFIAQAL